MSKHELKNLILQKLQDNGHPLPLQDLLDQTLAKDKGLYESQVKSTLLGLVRRNEVDVKNDKIQLPAQQL